MNATDPTDSQSIERTPDFTESKHDFSLSDEERKEAQKFFSTDEFKEISRKLGDPTTQTTKLEKQIWPLMPVERCYGEPDIWCENCKEALAAITALIQSEASRIANDKINNLPHGIYNVNKSGWMKLSNEDLDPKAEARRIAETVIGDDEDVNKRQGGTYWVQYSARNLLRREQRTKLKALTAPEGDTDAPRM